VPLAPHGPHEHGDPLRGDALAVDEALDVGGDGLGLGALVGAAPEGHLAAGVAGQRLRNPVGDGGHDGPGGPDDDVGAAQRALEADLGQVRPLGP
jgi:hypothetical protein